MIGEIIAAALAGFGLVAVFQFFRIQKETKRFLVKKKQLEEEEAERVAAAQEEHEHSLENLRAIGENIEAADLGELIELLNETFGAPKK